MAKFRDFIGKEPDPEGLEELYKEFQEFMEAPEPDVVSSATSKQKIRVVRGSPGPKGEKGDKGDTGERGLRGLRGITGPRGERGDRGEKGDKGERGEKGPQGERGPQGEIGPRGEKGSDGKAGAQGTPGPQGLRGEKGDKGDRGEAGPQGLKGVAGPKGDKGEKGDAGPRGIAGPKGDNGDKGDKGDKGEPGLQGIAGLAGAKGEKGDVGPAGSQGKRGSKGQKGDRGEKGEKGDVGPAGPQGEKGATGDSGVLHAIYPLKYDPKSKTLKVDLTNLNRGTTVLGNPGGGMGEAFKFVEVAGQPGLTAIQYQAETLRFDAGNNVQLITNPATNSITISSSGTNFFYQPDPPTSGFTAGSRWMDSDDGQEYIYINDGNTQQWVQPTVNPAMVVAVTSVTGSTYLATGRDHYIGVNATGPVTITLPSLPFMGREIIVKDESGRAGEPYRYITIVGATAADTVDNHESATINLNNAGLHFIYNNGWRIV